MCSFNFKDLSDLIRFHLWRMNIQCTKFDTPYKAWDIFSYQIRLNAKNEAKNTESYKIKCEKATFSLTKSLKSPIKTYEKY